MSVATELQTLQTNIGNAYDKISEKGGTVPANKNTDNLTTAIDSVPSGGGPDIGVPREIVNGKYQQPSGTFNYVLPSGATDVGDYALYYAFYHDSAVESADLSRLTQVSGKNGLSAAFAYSSLRSIDISNLTIVSGDRGISSLCSNTLIHSIGLDSLTTISGLYGAQSLCLNCSNLVSVEFTSLTTLTGNWALGQAFRSCTSLKTLSFPALTTLDTSQRDYFGNMLLGCSGVTVHFPAALQSVIGGWSDVVGGFGGTNTTVLYDL